MKNTQNSRSPITIILFGITGDLARRKLIPALWNLFISGNLPEIFSIVGFVRKKWSDKDLKNYAADILSQKNTESSLQDKKKFIENFFCVSGSFDQEESYKALSDKLLEIDKNIGAQSEKLFHLSVPPEIYETIFDQMRKAGLSGAPVGGKGWTRVLVEKPFGSDRYTAEKLNQKIGAIFKEDQVFRIDHYMGKESVQNILAFRFSNSLLEHLWNNQFIEKVNIRLWENLGMEGRGAFYDNIGALRDVGQNHILQMLAFVAMEDPGIFEAEAMRRSRAKVLSELHLIGKKEIEKFVKRGQYEGYLEESSVRPNSKTETYFRAEAYIENKRWKGVPFYLESGKGLGKSAVEIEVVFRKKDSFLCPPDAGHISQNTIVFRIQPDEGIVISFWTKHPGFEMKLDRKTLSFSREKSEKVPGAYERVIFDYIAGDQTLFASAEEVAASWKFITPIIENWDGLPLLKYERGWIPKK